MTWTSALKLTVLLGYVVTKIFYHDSVVLTRIFFAAYCALLGYFAFDLFRHYRQLGSLRKAMSESLRQQMGDRVSRYVLFEAKIMGGAVKLLLTPVSSLRRASRSYFVQSSDRALFWALLFLLVAEPIMLHIIIGNMDSPRSRLYAHTALAMLEVYGFGFIFGNIYYLGFSALSVGEHALTIKLGEVWQIETDLSNVKEAEFYVVRGLDSDVAKIALSSGPYTRLRFHRPIPAQFLFWTKNLDVVDVYMQPNEASFLKDLLEEHQK